MCSFFKQLEEACKKYSILTKKSSFNLIQKIMMQMVEIVFENISDVRCRAGKFFRFNPTVTSAE